MISIIDYGVGNIQAFINSFKRIGVEIHRANSSIALNGASKLILPGVGHFDHAMQKLNDSGMRPKLDELVLHKQVPLIGICVGMQMLAKSSEEGILPGLNWIPGKVRAFSSQKQCANLSMPHMGWNDLNLHQKNKLFSKGFDDGSQFYFLHSYFFDATNKTDVAATANYGFDFVAAISHENIHGVQFHPEKSHYWGERLLKNFLEL
jgi:glutamine amidotransferase